MKNNAEQEKFNYLDEHLPYLLKMLRHNLAKLRLPQFYLDWNAHFESFANNARNLKQFLTNGDKGNFRAYDFAPGFRARIDKLAKLMQKLDEQVFHLDKERPRTASEKFDVTAAAEVAEWIETEMHNFISALSAEDRKNWNERKADPTQDIPSGPTLGPTGTSGPPPQTACTAGPITSQNSTTSDPSGFKIVGLSKK